MVVVMRWIALVLSLMLCGCGASYTVSDAIMRVDFETTAQRDEANNVFSAKLQGWGFSVQRQFADWPDSMVSDLPVDLQRQAERTTVFWKHMDHSDFHGSIEALLEKPSLQIRLSDLRPGGFSPAALRLYRDVTEFFEDSGYRVTVEAAPPRTDDSEYYRTTAVNFFAAFAWWLVAWTAYAVVLGGATSWLLHRMRWSVVSRRIVFICACVFLATPMPIMTMFVGLFVPNVLLAIGGADGYEPFLKVEAIPLVMTIFAASLVLSVLAAMRFIRKDFPSPLVGEGA